MKRYTAKSDKKTAYGADGRVYAIDEMVCSNCKHLYEPRKASAPCFDCSQNLHQMLLKKHTTTRFEMREKVR